MTLPRHPDQKTELMTTNAPHVSAKDIAEASAVTSQSSGHQFEIQLGHLCNNRCVFCSSGQLTEMKLARPVPYEQIERALREARAAGAARLVFLGGEPTLHKRFVDACALAKDLGFEEIVIFTNGVRLPTPGFVESILALGDFTWRISIQGGNEEAHVAVTKRKRSFQRIVDGIAKLRSMGQRVTTNICVNEESYRSLPDFPKLIETYGIAQLHLDIVRPASTGMRTRDYLASIITRYSDMVPYYREMLEGFEKVDPDFDVNVGNLPYCLMPEWGHKIHHAGSNTVTQSAGAEGLENVDNKYEVHKSQRTYTEQCSRCAFRSKCTGVFRDYLTIYGDDEFKPVSLKKLTEMDPDQNNFDLLVEPLLEPLFKAPDQAPGWSRAEVFVDSRARRVEAHYRLAGRPEAGGVTLAFVPPNGALAEAPVFETNRYGLGATVVGRVDADTLLALLGWTTEHLRGARGVQVKRPLDEAGLRQRVNQSELMVRARTRMHKMVRRVQRKQRFGTWSYGGATPLPGGQGTRVRVHGPEGYHVDLRIDIGADGGKNQVNASFELGDGTSEAVARPVIEEIVATLRGR